MQTPRFPILALSRDGSIIPFDSEDDLASCNAVAFWRNRYYEDMTVVDEDARVWRVAAARLLSPTDAFRRAVTRITNGRIRVTLSWVRDEAHDGLPASCRLVADWLGRDPSFWEAAYDLDGWRSRVAACRTMAELRSLFD